MEKEDTKVMTNEERINKFQKVIDNTINNIYELSKSKFGREDEISKDIANISAISVLISLIKNND